MDVIDPAHWNSVAQVGLPILGILILGNIVFAKRMLTKLDQLDNTVTSTFPVYNSRLGAVEVKASTIEADLKEVSKLGERIAVIEYAMKIARVIQS